MSAAPGAREVQIAAHPTSIGQAIAGGTPRLDPVPGAPAGTGELVVLGGIAVLVWVRQLAVPPLLARVAGALAGASLYVYLVHWQVFPVLQDHLPKAATWGLTLGVGVAAGTRAQRIVDATEQALARACARSRHAVVSAVPAPEGLRA